MFKQYIFVNINQFVQTKVSMYEAYSTIIMDVLKMNFIRGQFWPKLSENLYFQELYISNTMEPGFNLSPLGKK